MIKCAFDEIVDIKKLIPNPKNPNKHPAKQIKLLSEIINYQGQRSPIIVSNRSGLITKGHGRLDAIRKLGWKEAAVDYQDYDNEAQEYADMVADNKIAELAEHDDSFMIETITNMDLSSLPSLDLLGIPDFKLPEIVTPGCEDDEIPEQVETICKPGDLWILGEHRVLCGDSTNVQHVERLMGGEKADMVFTDPPYNHASEEKLVSKSVSQAMKKLSESEWDKNFDISPVLINLKKVLAENATVYICTSWHLAGEIWSFMKQHSSYSGYCVWHKPNPMPSLMKRHWTWSSELICYATYGKHVFNFPSEGHASNVWSINKNQKNDLHPTMKPIEIPEKAIIHSSKYGHIILDIFLGSGSTLIACEKTNRKCFGMEIDPHYCDVIIARWEKYSGKKAHLSG